MKKKMIERIPYLGLPRVVKKKTAEYVSVTTVEEIGQQPCLFIEVYRNKRECRKIPVVRIVMTEKDFGTYLTASGKWSRGRITRNTWDDHGLIWREEDGHIHKRADVLAEENILYSQEDMERIKAFLPDVWAGGSNEWWEYIDRQQNRITDRERAEKTIRRSKRRLQARKEREEQLPDLPEKRILQYADDIFFHQKHYLYYRKHGARATVACTGCGSVTDARWKQGISCESQFERMMEEPRMGMYGTCPACGKKGKYVPQGRANDFRREATHLFLGQKYKENGMVFRYIEVEKEWQLEQACGERGLEMCGTSEGLTDFEIARVYFEPGKKIQKDFHKHNGYTGGDFWDDCNLSGLANITIKEARIMPETYEEMKGTFLQYSAMREYQKAEGCINPVDYLERYLQTPQIEMLVKMNLIRVVEMLIKCRHGIVKNGDAVRPDGFLGIRRERVKLLMENQGDLDLLKVMQMEKRMGQNWTDEQVKNLAEAGIDSMECHTALQYMTIQKLLNRIKRYAGCEFGTGCGHARGRLRQTAQFYLDYLDMRRKLGYSLENTVYQQPRDLSAAHDRMVYESNETELDKRRKEAEDRFPLIKKNYRKLRSRYFYEDDTYLIRPARSAGEIVLEGRFLHHCVGGDNYLRKHNEGESTILFLRSREEPEIPYITVEIGKDDRIRQWYGKYDKKPDQKNMQGWLDAYATRLKCSNMAAGKGEDTGETAVRTAVTA